MVRFSLRDRYLAVKNCLLRSNQWAAEWSVFSPNFKRMLNQNVGRNVDAGDYNMARQTIADNSQADMQLLLNSTYAGEQMVGENAALITISGGGKTLRPRLVKLSRWELKVKGDDTPYGDFVTRASDAIRVGPDGAITVMIRPPQSTANLLKTFRPDQIESFKVEGQWYVDDFGGIDQLVASRAGDGAPPQPGAVQPRAPQPVGTQPGYPPPAPGYPQPAPNYTTPPPAPSGGGVPAGGPAGWGSPDG